MKNKENKENKLTLNQLANKLKISRTTLWRYRKFNGFPQPLPEKGNKRLWSIKAIKEWLKNFTL